MRYGRAYFHPSTVRRPHHFETNITPHFNLKHRNDSNDLAIFLDGALETRGAISVKEPCDALRLETDVLPQTSTLTLTHHVSLLLGEASPPAAFLVSRTAESLVSLNCRYKHLFPRDTKKAQTSAMFTSDRKSVCFVCLSTAVFCGSDCIVLIRILVSSSSTIGHTVDHHASLIDVLLNSLRRIYFG